MDGRRVLRVVGIAIGVVLLSCTLLGAGIYWLLDANLNPEPHADTRLRAYLGALQAGDWATAAAQVDAGTGVDPTDTIRAEWAACTAAHGGLATFRVSTRPLDFGHAVADLTFADGTRDRWSVHMNPKRGPGWKIIGRYVPPACLGQPPDA